MTYGLSHVKLEFTKITSSSKIPLFRASLLLGITFFIPNYGDGGARVFRMMFLSCLPLILMLLVTLKMLLMLMLMLPTTLMFLLMLIPMLMMMLMLQLVY